MRHPVFAAAFGAILLLPSCALDEPAMVGSSTFPLEPHIFYPPYGPTTGQIATGEITGRSRALEQPIAFPHYTHATTLNISCEYCHSDARKSIHAGVPATQVCMNCHKLVRQATGADGPSPEIAKVVASYESGTPIPWQKVHDLPDYVHFAHSRHVNAGVQCTECHGQVQLMGQPETYKVKVEPAEGQPAPEEEQWKDETSVRYPMVRETPLQMGWCLNCHATHPSIDKNYGEKANERRAELKDCWTCHK
jgi:hypothetical protein